VHHLKILQMVVSLVVVDQALQAVVDLVLEEEDNLMV
jgi:hypothetical protein